MTHGSQQSSEKYTPPGSRKSAPHKKGAQYFNNVHDREKEGRLDTLYLGLSKG